MAGSEQVQLQRVLHMNSGEGETSYAKNSTMQKVIASYTKSIRKDLARDYYRDHLSDKMVIADLGCSTGPNAILMASDAIQSIISVCSDLGHPPPEFQVFLNDLPLNDFNSIFRSLGDYNYLSQGGDTEGQLCLIFGAPGSFYGRLFPSGSLNYVVSSTSLHWLSEMPEVLQEGSVVNKGRICLSKTSNPSVFDAYKNQFQAGFSLFLKCRGVEMMKGGIMVLTFMARRGSDPSTEEDSYAWELLAVALMDLVSVGLIEEQKVDFFNVPFYAPSMDEVEQEIINEGSFAIKNIELFEASYNALLADQYFEEEKQEEITQNTSNGIQFSHLKARHYAELTARSNWVVLESMIRNHFGGEIMEELFKRYCDLLEEYYCSRGIVLELIPNIIVAVERK
ncbi:putative jasmonic acid carboxyl methyltransferase 1 isoform X1 [Carex rostrata]